MAYASTITVEQAGTGLYVVTIAEDRPHLSLIPL